MGVSFMRLPIVNFGNDLTEYTRLGAFSGQKSCGSGWPIQIQAKTLVRLQIVPAGNRFGDC
jgi:hypothetical protein